jgi:apolipoprotein N-acyltransferase
MSGWRRPWIPSARDLFAIALSATLLLLSSSPFDVAFLAWFALVPVLLSIMRGSASRAFVVPLATWYLFDFAHASWMLQIEGIHLLNMGLPVVVHAAYFGVFGLSARWFHRRVPQWDPVTFPTIWVAVEYLRFHLGFLSFPWGILAYSQHSVLPVAGLAAYTGIHGVSFLIVTSNTVLARIAESRLASDGRRASRIAIKPVRVGAGVAAVLAGALLISASSRSADVRPRPLRVAFVQTDFRPPPRPGTLRDELFDRYAELTLRAAESAPALIAWPESSVRGRIPSDRSRVRDLGELARKSGAYLLVGSSGQEKSRSGRTSRRAANSAFLVAPDGELVGRYDKLRLLPFNEYLPLRGLLRWPSWIVSDVVDSEPGGERTVFDIGQARFGVLICWENLFPDDFRQTAARGVDFIVSMTNESFIQSPAARQQMLAMNVFRAIENRVAIVRTASTGVSAIIEPSGRIAQRIRDEGGNDVNVHGFLVGEVPLSSQRTFYTRHGEWFAHLSAGVLLAAAVLVQLRGADTGLAGRL